MGGRHLAVTFCLALVLAAPLAHADPRPAVVELFTSQGCSSCPPADALLGELARRPDVIALAFHVDYWDRLGWADPFASPAATARQRDYARALALPTVYTPQMVVDGATDVVGSDRAAVVAALAGRRDGVAVHVARADGRLTVAIGAADAGAPAEVTVIAYSRQAETKVARGENAGRTLTEFAIVRAVRPLGLWDGAAKVFAVDLSSLPDSATMAAVLVQGAGQGPVIGAAAAALR